MVDPYGNWTYDSTEPESRWNDMDRVAHWIEAQGYKPQTSMENLVVVLMLHFEGDCEAEDRDYPEPDKLIEAIALFVEQSGTLRDFDYEP